MPMYRVGGAIQYCWHCGKKPDPSDKKCQDCQKELKHEYRVSATPVQKDAIYFCRCYYC